MKKLIEDNYKSIVARGLITPGINSTDFLLKLEEEVQEFIDAEIHNLSNRNEELADIILVCLNIACHYDIDIEKELENKIQKNFERAK